MAITAVDLGKDFLNVRTGESGIYELSKVMAVAQEKRERLKIRRTNSMNAKLMNIKSTEKRECEQKVTQDLNRKIIQIKRFLRMLNETAVLTYDWKDLKRKLSLFTTSAQHAFKQIDMFGLSPFI